MLFNLVVCKFEHLKSIWESGLGSHRLSEIINNFLIRESLLNIFVIEVDNRVPIRIHLSSDTIVKNDLFLPILIHSLNLAIMAYNLFYDLVVRRIFVMILAWEFHIKILRVIFVVTDWRNWVLWLLLMKRIITMFIILNFNVVWGGTLVNVMIRIIINILRVLIILRKVRILIIFIFHILLIIFIFIHVRSKLVTIIVLEILLRHWSLIFTFVFKYTLWLLN